MKNKCLAQGMEFSIKFDIIKSGCSVVYFEGSHVISSKKYCIIFLSLKIDGVITCTWVKVFRIIPEFRILRLTLHSLKN